MNDASEQLSERAMNGTLQEQLDALREKRSRYPRFRQILLALAPFLGVISGDGRSPSALNATQLLRGRERNGPSDPGVAAQAARD